MLATVTSQASKEATAFNTAVQQASSSLASAVKELPRAAEALSTIQQLYHLAEPSVFYVNPESPEELAAQPDPLGSGSDESHPNSLADVSTILNKLAIITPEKPDAAGEILTTLKELALKSQQLDGDMKSLAEAWRNSNTNFRTHYFLSDPDNAVARMFQGLLALSGDVLPTRSRTDEISPLSAKEISGRIAALRDIYLGKHENAPTQNTPGLKDLVSTVAPLRAAAVERAVAQASALSQTLELSPDNAEARRQLLSALNEVTRQLVLSAEALGIRIVEEKGAASD